MHDYRKLRIWQESIALATLLYPVTATFPKEERYGLAAQIRSAAVSISFNIAEGCGRGSDRELARFLRIALGSLSELESQVELSKLLRFIPEELELDLHSLRKQIRRLHDQLAT